MPKISSVIYNRLKRGMPLQMDGTLNYGLYSHVRVTPERIREDRSPFNTYLNRGIPPYPVSSGLYRCNHICNTSRGDRFSILCQE